MNSATAPRLAGVVLEEVLFLWIGRQHETTGCLPFMFLAIVASGRVVVKELLLDKIVNVKLPWQLPSYEQESQARQVQQESIGPYLV